MEKKVIVLFETTKSDGTKKYDFEEFGYTPRVDACKQLSSELEKERRRRLTSGGSVVKEVNVVNFQIV